MVTDKLLDIVFNFLEKMLDKLPVMDISIDLSAIQGFLSIVGTALYFFPWQKVAPILAIILLLQMWRILISIIKTIWSVLPISNFRPCAGIARVTIWCPSRITGTKEKLRGFMTTWITGRSSRIT